MWIPRGSSFLAKAKATKVVWFPPTTLLTGKKAARTSTSTIAWAIGKPTRGATNWAIGKPTRGATNWAIGKPTGGATNWAIGDARAHTVPPAPPPP